MMSLQSSGLSAFMIHIPSVRPRESVRHLLLHQLGDRPESYAIIPGF